MSLSSWHAFQSSGKDWILRIFSKPSINASRGTRNGTENSDRFQRGEIRLLCNHSVLSTGFDAPKTDRCSLRGRYSVRCGTCRWSVVACVVRRTVGLRIVGLLPCWTTLVDFLKSIRITSVQPIFWTLQAQL